MGVNAEKCTWHADAVCLLTDLAHVSLLSNHISPEALMKEAGEKKKKAGHDLWLTVEVQALKRIHFFHHKNSAISNARYVETFHTANVIY